MKITYTKNPLGAALAAAAPVMAKTSLDRAENALAAIEAECLAYLDTLLGRLEQGARQAESLPLKDRITSAYDSARRMIGVATAAQIPAIDAAAKSLCEVADGMLTRNELDWKPIGVHLDTMRVLRHHNLPPEAVEQLLAGLQALRSRFAVGLAGACTAPQPPAIPGA